MVSAACSLVAQQRPSLARQAKQSSRVPRAAAVRVVAQKQEQKVRCRAIAVAER